MTPSSVIAFVQTVEKVGTKDGAAEVEVIFCLTKEDGSRDVMPRNNPAFIRYVGI